ncbi:TetR/AcrR family transcriptional regulator [Streptomyces sp. NPDC058257]|uniref:TetR/AcrR family transcriptional regulator n=1 Tax=Streptomyces sp. NPDC058257 TaxID=3346409 RepID=UPI0036ECDADA
MPASSPNSPDSLGSLGSLNERRKAETRLDIARTAAALFVEDGLRATRAEDIARAAGVAPRTFYRYFATKEEAVAPLFAAGAQQWAAAVRGAPAGLSVRDALRYAAARALVPDSDAAPGVAIGDAEALEWVRALLRMTRESAALRAVWSDACHASEETLISVLAEREGRGARAQGQAQAQEQVEVEVQKGAQVPSLELRLVAGVASAAVRVAVETWALSDAPAGGAGGPAALAERCIEALEGFRWP